MATWDELSKAMKVFDALIAKVIVGDEDWTPPGPTSSPSERIEYLRRVAEGIRHGLAEADKLSAPERERTLRAAKDAVEKAKEIYLRFWGSVPRAAVKTVVDAQDAVKDALDKLYEDITTALKYFGVGSLGAESVVIIGGICFLVWMALKKK